MSWFWQGVREPTKTIAEPPGKAPAGLTPGRPVATRLPPGFDPQICPTEALQVVGDVVQPVFERCIHCLRCQRAGVVDWEADYRWGSVRTTVLPKEFQGSVHVRVVDAGDCGACLNEVRQLASPVYSLHRYGIYITPSPREADLLLVVGPVSDGMSTALAETYRALPEPRRVIAVGVCAINGGIFAESFAVSTGVAGFGIPVDAVVPGCPPPPVAILDAIRQVMGQVPPRREENA